MDKITAKMRNASKKARLTSNNNDRFESLRLVNELFQDAGTAKLPATIDYVKTVLNGGDQQFIVFAHHQDVMDGVCLSLTKQSIDHIRIDGRVNSADRSALVNHFQSDPNCRVAVLSITAAGCGLNITKAEVVIFAELYWNPGLLQQCEDRAHRIGQTKSVDVRYLVGRDTMDVHVWDVLKSKLDVLGRTLNGQQQSLNAATSETELSSSANKTDDSFLKELMQRINNFEQRDADTRKKIEESRQRWTQPSQNPAPAATELVVVEEKPVVLAVDEDDYGEEFWNCVDSVMNATESAVQDATEPTQLLTQNASSPATTQKNSPAKRKRCDDFAALPARKKLAQFRCDYVRAKEKPRKVTLTTLGL
eukprot:TRINITY_DN11437_c0_g1_i3.p1 TRINITY_DN11437_c0_g1~~TRINITY_DN11437_c0_g1_i3.p1  ORF type:complete len:372 (+),score=57.70 TRINITY_DN11437_c0_g1_i3:26-1117(+)